MRFILTFVLAVMMLATTLTTVASRDAVESVVTEEEFDEDFDDGGYDGAWNTVAALDVEIFLPDGWTGEDVSEDGVCYRARSADGAVSLTVCYPLDGAPAGEVASAGGKDARLLRGDDGSVTVAMALSEDRLASFRFDRASEDALAESLALQIAGSCTDVWF